MAARTLVRYALLFFTLLFLLTGVFLIVVGAVGLATEDAADLSRQLEEYVDLRLDLERTSLQALSTFLLVLGVVVFFTSLLGCCGSCRESRVLLAVYAGILILILVIEIAVGTVAFVYKEELEHFLTETTGFYKALLKSYDDGDGGPGISRDFWDQTQIEHRCCGYKGPGDWQSVAQHGIPDTCCITVQQGCGRTGGIGVVWQEGCEEAVKGILRNFLREVERHANEIGISGAALTFIHIASILAACCLVCSRKD